jgi:hypothetical protein
MNGILRAGKGIITSEGAYWKAQRTLLSHAFRVSILEDTAGVAKRAVDRLSAKLEVSCARRVMQTGKSPGRE